MKFVLIWVIMLKIVIAGSLEYDLKLRMYDATDRIGMAAKMVEFGGDKEPLCKLAISNDGRYFFLKKVNSSCIKLTNSKGMKIICNSNKSVCKTRKELVEFIQSKGKKGNTGITKAAKYDAECKKGDIESCLELGIMYYTGKEIAKDHEKALKIFKPLCEETVKTCPLFSKIILSEKIEGGIEDALYILTQSCKSGDAKSCAKLGILYNDGKKVKKDSIKADYYFNKACEEGEGTACGVVGAAYLKGEGYKKDINKAISMFKHGCELNSTLSCAKLGSLYSSDEYGVKNIQKAIYLWDKACDSQQQNSCSVLGAT